MGRAGLAALLAALLAGCSPVYVYRSAKGHASLLWHRKNIAKALLDPKVAPELKEKLTLALEIKAFGVEKLALAKTDDYETYAPVDGRYLTWLVTACPPLKLEPYVWKFPLAGSYPYKGHFKEADARKDEAYMENRGYDAWVRGVSAYNTPLWISDPLPTTALRGTAGDLAELLLHEMAHGTLYFKGQTEFDEQMASFVGERGAQAFLSAKYGPASPELAGYVKDQERQKKFDEEMAALRGRLQSIYGSDRPDAAKMDAREAAFKEAEARFEAIGTKFKKLNNAVVAAFGVYREKPAVFAKAFDKAEKSWPKFWVLLNALDKKRPSEDLEALVK